MIHHLIQLVRPRTLPLSVAVICCGNALAFHHGTWRVSVFLFSLLTALSLQALSNMANDYGDGIRGTDAFRDPRAPVRLTQSGAIAPALARQFLLWGVGACALFGLVLLLISFSTFRAALPFVFFGLISIVAAITYTVGRFPYAYYALGEMSVFCFFGLLGVIGSYYLQTQSYSPTIILPAIGAGLLSAAVLHINNMRDLDSDYRAGKQTIAGKLGLSRGKTYHFIVIFLAICCYFLYGILFAKLSLIAFLFLPILINHLKTFFRAKDAVEIGKELKKIIVFIFLFNLAFGLGIILGK